jgi:hypothetical protein
MPVLLPDLVNLLPSLPKVYVETGTYRGDGIREMLASGQFTAIYSIELHPQLAAEAATAFEQYDHVHIVQGDSAVTLPSVLAAINEPCVIYLDAHWSGTGTAKADEICPILDELAAISRDEHTHVIIIDDMRLVGRISTSGGNSDYSREVFDWSHVTLDGIRAAVAPECVLLDASTGEYLSGPRDRLIIYRPREGLDLLHG